MCNKFLPPDSYNSLYKKPLTNKDSYGIDSQIVKPESPTRIDIYNDEIIYLGWGKYGEDENSSYWKIKKIFYDDGVWKQMYADGNNIYGKYKSVDYVQIIAILIAGMKELKQEINNLKR